MGCTKWTCRCRKPPPVRRGEQRGDRKEGFIEISLLHDCLNYFVVRTEVNNPNRQKTPCILLLINATQFFRYRRNTWDLVKLYFMPSLVFCQSVQIFFVQLHPYPVAFAFKLLLIFWIVAFSWILTWIALLNLELIDIILNDTLLSKWYYEFT